MSFNLGVQNYPGGYLGGFGFGTVGIYLYEDIYYRQWITEIALAFYEGRQDEFVWLDLLKQFRNPEKQQIIPLNFTKEIIDETSILYRESPIYRVKDRKTGEFLVEDQKLWEEIMRHSRYLQTMDRVDRWCKLLGTVLIKVAFIDQAKGTVVAKNEGGVVQLDVLNGGVYDVKYTDSPYYISELMIGFGQGFAGFNRGAGIVGKSRTLSGGNQALSGLGASAMATKSSNSLDSLGSISMIYWAPNSHKVYDDNEAVYETENPYGIIPAIPFFNADPAHYYFLPINEPLIYANHALNMRLTDLNHIAKFQSFGVPVLTGVERGTSLRRGRPADDFNQLRAGSATRRAGMMSGFGGFAQGNQFRTFDNSFGFFADGNADANAMGMSIGPDTAIAVGEKGDFKFEHPKADITGLANTIERMQDWVRINHGLQPKFSKQMAASGFSQMLSKIGVLEENIRRQKLFMEREQQLFEVIKKLWNIHYSEMGALQFNPDACLEITYVEPQFPVDPMTKVNLVEGQRKIIESGDRRAIKEIFKHMDEHQIQELIKQHHLDRMQQMEREMQLIIKQGEITEKSGIEISETNVVPRAQGGAKAVTRQDNRLKHAEDSSKQRGKNLDPRRQPKEDRAAKPQGKD